MNASLYQRSRSEKSELGVTNNVHHTRVFRQNPMSLDQGQMKGNQPWRDPNGITKQGTLTR